ncbi:CGNR zinc finger domain-containing protein [Microbacterium radiodurans]|uniref:CGNR zinc finger domain-containing protein n=1 Tax=Microbacterium radiodurans TaxID=661398 RepID=A0A5J5ISZ1_9MICO|nr:CGNR zinc finger domain-containing protein [Microbacterium radiodurans]KAA9089133.1 CGNR zinc finger domain-containing protein [Microbacterium radiodurans]
MEQDEELLLAVLNSEPVIDGRRSDHLDGEPGDRLVRSWGGTGSAGERDELRRVRSALHAAIRSSDAEALTVLAEVVSPAVQVPHVTSDGLSWRLTAPADRLLAVQAVAAWSSVVARFPGRVRACANGQCNLFLVDHSRPGTAKWCSMAACGNRMKARAHAERARGRGRLSSADDAGDGRAQ